jgi:hypothetical protein
MMEPVWKLTTFEEEEAENAWLQYWLSRPPDERVAEVERLRRDYYRTIRGEDYGLLPGLRGSLRLVEREEC